jgi:hypothetical protein
LTAREANNRFVFRSFDDNLEVHPADPVAMRNLNFGFFDDSGQPRESRILMFYSFETEERLARSGILHYHLVERRFVGPRHDSELTQAALAFLEKSGRLQTAS